jgi:hypothetical protein
MSPTSKPTTLSPTSDPTTSSPTSQVTSPTNAPLTTERPSTNAPSTMQPSRSTMWPTSVYSPYIPVVTSLYQPSYWPAGTLSYTPAISSYLPICFIHFVSSKALYLAHFPTFP